MTNGEKYDMGLINKIIFAPVNGKPMSGYSFLYQKVYDEIIGEPTEPEPELGFPISWNSMEVMGNATFPISEEGVVKVSDYIPSVDEMANTIITVTDANDIRIFKYDETFDSGIFYIIGYTWAAGNKNGSMAICIFPTPFEADGMTAEAGLYATNFGSIGVNADCVLDKLKIGGETLNITDANTTLVTEDNEFGGQTAIIN